MARQQAEREADRLKKYQAETVENMRTTRKALMFGMDESFTYGGHKHAQIKNMV